MLSKQSSGSKWTQKNVDTLFLTWSYLQITVMWKLLINFRDYNPWNLINNGNGK